MVGQAAPVTVRRPDAPPLATDAAGAGVAALLPVPEPGDPVPAAAAGAGAPADWVCDLNDSSATSPMAVAQIARTTRRNADLRLRTRTTHGGPAAAAPRRRA